MKPPPQPLRAASYNIRVDHTDDHGTVHDWPYRRALVTSSIVALRADVIGLQEPSPTQAAHLQVDLGPAWGVAVAACDPEAWRAAGPAGPAEGQKRDGNGVAWRRDRLRLLSMDDFALPSDSPFKRSCVVARLRDRASGCELSLLSAHFDHADDDELGRGSPAPVPSKPFGPTTRVASRLALLTRLSLDAVAAEVKPSIKCTEILLAATAEAHLTGGRITNVSRAHRTSFYV